MYYLQEQAMGKKKYIYIFNYNQYINNFQTFITFTLEFCVCIVFVFIFMMWFETFKMEAVYLILKVFFGLLGLLITYKYYF